MPSVLVVGATRGLGFELAKYYHGLGYQVIGTARSSPPKNAPQEISWISGVDVSEESAGKTIVEGLEGKQQNVVILTAGFFGKESLDEPNYEAEVTMYKTSAIAPVFIAHALTKAEILHSGSKFIIVSSESGSISLRHEKEGGGMFGHHASKAASNMVGKLLSLDLKSKDIAVGIVHPGFMRTEMTASVGFDQFWDEGGAVTPDAAAKSLANWVEHEFDINKTGEYWAPRGPGDIGTAEAVLGPKNQLATPLHLPW
nr:3-oxoacyl-[acyl-carrier-protein] reductase fabg [Quercus suber]